MKTGYEDWDQNLKTLSQSLFPDPSLVARGYYYGSEARKAQLDAAKTQDQMAAGHTALGMQFGRVPNPTYQPGFGGTQIMVDPNSQPAPGPAPAAAPGPTGLGAAVTAMPPQAVANGVVAGVENNAQSGTLPPMAPATAVSGPEPTTTATNGTTPANSPLAMKPGSVTSAGGGGVVMAPPGAADGTPAPSSFNMGQLIALQIAAGATPDAAYATARGTLGNMVKNGQIALPLAEQMAAFYGAPSMRNQTIANEGALAVGAQAQAGETARNAATNAAAMARQQVATAEARRADQEAPERTVDENGNPIFVYRKDTSGKRAYDSTVANTAQTQGGAYGMYLDPNKPSEPAKLMRARDAEAQRRVAQLGSKDQLDAALGQAIAIEQDPAKRQALILQRNAAVALPRVVDPDTQRKQQIFDYENDQRLYSTPQRDLVHLGIKDPVAFDDQANAAINAKTSELLNSRDVSVQGNPGLARERAIQLLQTQGLPDGTRLPTPAEVNEMRRAPRSRLAGVGDTRIGEYRNPRSQTNTDHMMIHLIPQEGLPKPGTPGAPAARATTPSTPKLGPPVVLAPNPDVQGPPAPRAVNRQIRAAPPISSAIPPLPAGAAPVVNRQIRAVPLPPPAPIPLPDRLNMINQNRAANGYSPLSPGDLGMTVAPGPATAAPAVAAPVPLGPAHGGEPDGTIVITNTGQRGVVRGGQVYAAPN